MAGPGFELWTATLAIFGDETLDVSAGRGHNLWRICRPLCQMLFLSELG
jgi:hypothetical protein